MLLNNSAITIIESDNKAVNNDGGDIRNAVFFNGCTAKFRRREHDGIAFGL